MCAFYKRQGHTRDGCYKLHGYPSSQKVQGNGQVFRHDVPTGNSYNTGTQNYRQNNNYKGKGVVANVHVTPGDASVCPGGDHLSRENQSDNNLTKEQFGQLMTLMQQFQNEYMGENPNTA